MAEPLVPAPGVSVELGEDGWTLSGPLPEDYSALRVLVARLDDGGALALAAARPAGARGHGHELVVARLHGEEGASEISDALLSAEYTADGTIRRVGLELYPAGEDYPVRAAGEATDAGTSEADGLRRRSANLAFRLSGRPGHATFDILDRIA